LLLGRRVDDTHGNGEYSCGGGHVEAGENLAESARREIREEWGIEIDLPRFLCAINLRKYDGLHYVSFGFSANWVAGEPRPETAGEFADHGWVQPGRAAVAPVQAGALLHRGSPRRQGLFRG